MPTVSFQAPTDYGAEAEAIQRRRAYAQLLQQQGMEGLGNTEVVGGWAIPRSPMEGLGKALQQGVGAYQQSKLDEKQKELASKYQIELADTLKRATEAGTGSPGIPAQAPATPMDDEGNAMPGVAARPVVAPDPASMAAILASHPATQQVGIQQMIADANRQRTMAAFGLGPQTGGAPGAPTPSAAAPSAPDAGAAQPGAVPPAAAQAIQQATVMGIPRNVAYALVMTDPTGASLAKAIAAASAESQKLTRFNAGGGVVRGSGDVVISAPDASGRVTTYGPNGPSVALAPGAEAATTQLHNIPKPDAAMQKIQLSNQRVLEVTQPEYLAYTNSGGKVLPVRYQAIANELPGVQFRDAGGSQQTAQPPSGTLPMPNQPQIPALPSGALPPASAVVQAPPKSTAAQEQANIAALDAEIKRANGDPRKLAILNGEKQDVLSRLNAIQGGQVKPEPVVLGAGQSQPEQTAQIESQAASKKLSEGAAERALDKPVATLAYKDAVANMDRMANEAYAIMNHRGLGGVTGLTGAFPDVPGSHAADARARLATLKSQTAFSVLQAMRAASKTGGALGQVSDKEGELLQNNITALNTAQSMPEFKAALQRTMDYVKGAKERMAEAYQSTYPEPGVTPINPERRAPAARSVTRYDANGNRL